MTRKDLEELEKELMKLVVSRRHLGGYSSEAEAILLITETLYKLTQHIREQAPRK